MDDAKAAIDRLTKEHGCFGPLSASKQSGSRVILEQLGISDIAPQGVHRFVA